MDFGRLWENRLKGEPIFRVVRIEDDSSNSDPGKADLLTRILVITGCMIDIPLLLMSDTHFLPIDLVEPRTQEQPVDRSMPDAEQSIKPFSTPRSSLRSAWSSPQTH